MTEPHGQIRPSFPQGNMHGYPQQGYPHPGHPQQNFPPPTAFTPRYRRTAWWLIWTPVALMAGAALLSVVLFMYADSDPRNAAAGYLGIVVWVLMLVGGPLLLGAFIPGLVMISRSNRARAIMRAAGYGSPV